jgi:hypothetical protein
MSFQVMELTLYRAICSATKLVYDAATSRLINHFFGAMCTAAELIQLMDNTTKQDFDYFYYLTSSRTEP